MSTALLLIAHGSRNPDANADLVVVAEAVRSNGAYHVVETGYLELAEPTIAEAGRRCVERGARHVVLAPYFLSAGVHVRRDLRRHRDELAARFPEVGFVLAEPLGLHPALVDLVLQRAAEARQQQQSPGTAVPGL